MNSSNSQSESQNDNRDDGFSKYDEDERVAEPDYIAGVLLTVPHCSFIDDSLQESKKPTPRAGCFIATKSTKVKIDKKVEVKSITSRFNNVNYVFNLIEAPKMSKWNVTFDVPANAQSLDIEFNAQYIVEDGEIKDEKVSPTDLRIFLTPNTYSPGVDFNSVADANRICENLGTSIKGFSQMRWIALLADDNITPALRDTSKIKLMNDTLVKDSGTFSDFLSGKSVLTAIDVGPFGEKIREVDTGVWTGMSKNPTNCINWSSNSSNDRGRVGNFSKPEKAFIFTSVPCKSKIHHLYCITKD